MPVEYSEADTRAKLINPALYARGWTEVSIRREVNAGGIEWVRGRWRRGTKRADYLLRIRVGQTVEPVPVALIEAKKNTAAPHQGLEQAKQYSDAKRLNVPFVFTSNGYRYVEYDRFTGQTSAARAMSRFPTPGELRRRYEEHVGFSLEDEAASPLLAPYTGGDAVRRYYQDAAIRAAMEKIARGEKRLLLSLATGSGKTRIAVHLLKRIADAGQLRRVLFVCDRRELREQAQAAFHKVFGNDAQPVSSGNARKNARILIATYQTLDVATDDADASFLVKHYPKNYFSHVVIDECHRSAWGTWSIVLTRNPEAVQIGLTATPRELKTKEQTPETQADAQITRDNLDYFGEPVYEYDMGRGIADGYLAACEIQRGRVNLDDTGITLEEIIARNPVDAITGEAVGAEKIRQMYEKTSYEQRILLPDRVEAMTQDLFAWLAEGGRPEQKTIIFCVSDNHADRVAAAMNNLYARWCAERSRTPAEHYAFKCTAKSSGNDMLPDLRTSSRSWFVATTVELLTTGVDVPRVANIVFFRYMRSPLAFHQMVGRGTRLHAPTNKLVFRVYDYTDATRLFGEGFVTAKPGGKKASGGDEGGDEETERAIEVEGFDVVVSEAGRYILAEVDGKVVPVTLEEYKQQVAARLVEEAPDLGAFRKRWVDPTARGALLRALPSEGQSARLIRKLEEMEAYDLYDVLAEIGYGMAPRTLVERAEAFTYKNAGWLEAMPKRAGATIRALTAQFAKGGTEELESRYIWQVAAVQQAGGVAALRALGKPGEVLREAKARVFAA